jgi:hypothetical protein
MLEGSGARAQLLRRPALAISITILPGQNPEAATWVVLSSALAFCSSLVSWLAEPEAPLRGVEEDLDALVGTRALTAPQAPHRVERRHPGQRFTDVETANTATAR